MRALFKPSAAPGLEMIECVEPTPGPTDVKIRVEKTGIYVVAFSYPVVPMGKARIRVQVCATHTKADIDTCVAAFVTARDKQVS